MNSKQQEIKTSSKRGITLLIAVLTASLMLSISLSIFNIAIKELVISSSGRDSHTAFYAADSGIECALYWDYRNAFSTTTTSNISCGGASFTVGGQALSTFTIGGASPDGCVTTTVNKVGGETTIEARGYNNCTVGSPRKTERAIRVKY